MPLNKRIFWSTLIAFDYVPKFYFYYNEYVTITENEPNKVL